MTKSSGWRLLSAVACCLALSTSPSCAAPRPFETTAATTAVLPIVLPFDEATGAGINFDRLSKLQSFQVFTDPQGSAFRAARYLREALQRMTGSTAPVLSRSDLSTGYVLTTLDLAPPEVRADPAIKKALANTGEDSYNDREAFFIRTEPKRTLIVANTPDGLIHGVVALLETVGYEVLGMGPNWTAVPDFHTKPLVFNAELADRPGFYIRGLWATSGQDRGVGTLQKVFDPDDEPVETSYERWRIGTHQAGQSMPSFPGHALQTYHRAVLQKMKDTGNIAGFLVKKCTIGAEADRPAASPANKDELWIGSDPKALAAWISNGTEWKPQNILSLVANLDLSVPFVREIILDGLKTRAESTFAKSPDDVFVFGTDPEDGGGYGEFASLVKNPNWYPDYLKEKKLPFGRPYILNGFKGLNQPTEEWDPTTPCDTVFAFNNWLLREFDSWIDSLSAAQQVTSTGKSKKSLLRCSFYSYNYHDVPPNFNLDPRIRVMIASYPKHRGAGKWRAYVTQKDMVQAFRAMLPREPSGDYWIISLSYYNDAATSNIQGSRLPATIRRRIVDNYEAGFRALNAETDFNFGKQGLEYYLYNKMLWNPRLTDAQLEALRDRWFQRAFGSGSRQMKSYYDFMAPENYHVNAPNNWAKAIRLIQSADDQVDPTKEPEAQKRLDDVKQYWYFYYLLDTGEAEAKAPAFREFLWKGQMSYATAMHAPVRRYFKTNLVKDAAPDWNSGPAHFTSVETSTWWTKILDRWKVTPVASFSEAKLANGKLGSSVDTNDLVAVKEFDSGPSDIPFYYNSAYGQQLNVLTIATREKQLIGFSLIWNYNGNDRHYSEKDVAYGIKVWNPQTRDWDELVDKSMTTIASQAVINKDGVRMEVAKVLFPAPRPGTYRIETGYGGNGARLTTPFFDPLSGDYSEHQPFTHFETDNGHTQSPVYLYLPRGTQTLDLEVWDTANDKKLQFFTGLPSTGLTKTRLVNISQLGTHTVKLNPGEDGSVVQILGNGFNFPHLYSVPSLWAKTPKALLLPRSVAIADGLTILP